MFIAATALILAACEGPMGPIGPMGPQGAPGQNGYNGQDGRDGRDGHDGEGTKWFRQKFTVYPEEWGVDNGAPGQLNTFFFALKELPELTREVYDNGSVIAYIENAEGIKNGMPFVWPRGEVTDGGKNDYLWTEIYDFDFAVGEVGFYLRYSDFETGVRPLDPITFYVVLIWP